MINVVYGMDPRSLEIKRGRQHVGFINWHPERSPRIVLTQAASYLTVEEIRDVLDEYETHRKRLGT